MKLSEEEKKYASALYGKIFNDSYKRGNSNLNTLDEVSNKAFHLVKARLDSYKETYRKSRKIIDDEDKIEIFREIRIIVNRQCTEPFRIGRGFIRPSFSKEEVEGHLMKVISFAETELEFIVRGLEMDRNMTEKQRGEEYELLKWIYNKADGKRDELVELDGFLEENANFNESEVEKIAYYLEGEGFIELPYDSGSIVELTHKGIKEIRNPTSTMKQSPTLLTQHFHNQVANVGDNYGAIQQQKGGTNNTQINSSSDTDNLNRKIDELITAINSSALSDIQKITTESHLQTIQKLTRIDITPEVSQEVESRIVALKDILSTSADLVSLGQIILPMIGHFFHIASSSF